MAELVWWGDEAFEQTEMELEMIYTENHCVDCPMGCIDCGRKHEVVYECDERGALEDELYEHDGEQLCIDCLKEKCRIRE